MRDSFAKKITTMVKNNDNIVLLSGDIGNRMFDDLRAAKPQQFYNCGIAEAQMMSLAAGLALSGLRPFVYTITPFTTTRCLEQIKVGVCYHDAPVMIIGTGSGLSYSQLGATHHSLEDISIMRAMPEMVVFCPADAREVEAGMDAFLHQDKPVYMRLGKKGEPVFHGDLTGKFAFGRAITMQDGVDIALLSTGNTMPLAFAVAKQLESQKISCQIESFHTIKPLDGDKLNTIFNRHQLVITIEEHNIIGGFYGAIAEWLVQHAPKMAYKCLPCAMPDQFISKISGQDELRARGGLDVETIAQKIIGKLQAS